MYAIIQTGGKQYKVETGKNIRVEKLPGEPKNEIAFQQVLMIGGNDAPKIGRPYVEGASVKGQIIAQDRAKKIIVFKKKRRKGYQKRMGHRQAYTEVRITEIIVQ